MFPTLRDKLTGEERACPAWAASVFWWTEGNGACDCNRVLAMGIDAEDDGCKTERFIAVAVHGDLEGWTREDVLLAMNEGYPHE